MPCELARELRRAGETEIGLPIYAKKAGAGTVVIVNEEKDAAKHKGKKTVLQEKVMSAVMKQDKKELGL